jgi:2-aminoadipate transaminase
MIFMKKTIAFVRGIPPVESFPKEKLVECAKNAIINQGDLILQYGNAAGYMPLVKWVAEKHQVKLENVIMGQGSLQVLDFFIHSCLYPGDLVFIEQPTYDRSLNLFKRAGMSLKGFHLKNGKMELDDVEASLRNGEIPKVFYMIPDFQNPSGALMPLEHRQKLLDLAKQYGFLIIEDGPYRHLRYSGKPVPTFIEKDKGHVIHMSSFSKMISPGLRVGYMIMPDSFAFRVRQYLEESCINSSYLNQAIIHEFIRNDWLGDHIEGLLKLYGIRLNVMLESLQKYIGNRGEWLEPQGGFFVGLNLNYPFHMPNAEECNKAGIQLSNSAGFFVNGGDNFLRLPFCALAPQEIQTGIQRLTTII